MCSVYVGMICCCEYIRRAQSWCIKVNAEHCHVLCFNVFTIFEMILHWCNSTDESSLVDVIQKTSFESLNVSCCKKIYENFTGRWYDAFNTSEVFFLVFSKSIEIEIRKYGSSDATYECLSRYFDSTSKSGVWVWKKFVVSSAYRLWKYYRGVVCWLW